MYTILKPCYHSDNNYYHHIKNKYTIIYGILVPSQSWVVNGGNVNGTLYENCVIDNKPTPF